MAKITQVGPGRKTTGTIDGITYVTRNGVTYARSAPTMPASAYNTPAAKKRQAIFKMVQMHLKLHLRTIKQTFSPKGNGTPANRYYSLNGKALSAALDALAELYCDGQDVTITDVEQAIADYAAEHPTSIKIASKSGYQEVYLTGEWPSTITLNALTGDSTVIIIVNEYGVQTTIAADGTTTVTSYTGSNDNQNDNQNSGGGSTGGSSSGSGSGSESGSGSGSESGGSGSNTNDSNGTNTGGSSTGSETGGGSSSGGSESGGSSTGSETGGDNTGGGGDDEPGGDDH